MAGELPVHGQEAVKCARGGQNFDVCRMCDCWVWNGQVETFLFDLWSCIIIPLLLHTREERSTWRALR